MAVPDLLTPSRHRPHEDAIAILTGTLLVSLGISLFGEATLTTGSTAGLALLVQYATGISFGLVFFLVNLPFYVLAVLRMGWSFALKTFASVLLVSFFSAMTPHWVDIVRIEPLYAALAGGTLMGLGILALFRHKASVGGVNILALYLQDRHGIRAGYFQLAVDICILIVALFVLPFDRVLLSLIGALALNLTLAMNHRPGRYVGFS